MSFIYSYFSCDVSTPSEKANAAALKEIIKSHKTALKSEFKQYDLDCKQAIKDAEAEYKRIKKEAEETMFRNTLDAVNREIEIILTTDEYRGSDEKTKAKIAQFQSWVGCAAQWSMGCHAHKEKEEETKQKEMEEGGDISDDQKEQQPPSYQHEDADFGSGLYPSEKDVLISV
ncbi:hypothetical protein BGZ95_002871 [Linnemannia exigua]|uniref:Uncharacterized protein n=1 Tax=Linnemannia exigua TaxID=604196 RepID=A0AAD4H2S2_9FUNG|nr:hypothetical protein BGZ95_002871 [Linnemannia exigua]